MISEKVLSTFTQLDRLCSSVPPVTDTALSSPDQLRARFRLGNQTTDAAVYAPPAPTSEGATPELSISNIDPSLDIRHLRDNFPKARDSGWLVTRLGTCNTQRRDAIKYRQLHRSKLANQRDEQSFREVVGDDPSTIATTLEAGDPSAAMEEMMPDRHTLRTVATSFASIIPDDNSGELSVPQLTNLILDGIELQYDDEIECPFCRTIQLFTKPSEWKRHVFSELRPYVCTFEDCDHEPFSTRHDWFSHETHCHRKRWVCDRCYEGVCVSRDGLASHLSHHHPGAVTEAQLPFVIESCEKHQDDYGEGACPLCNAWAPSMNKEESKSKYCRHLGRHLQQLSLSAIPTWIDGLEARNSTLNLTEIPRDLQLPVWIPYEDVTLLPGLRDLNRYEVQEYCRVRQYQIDFGENDENRVANEDQAVYEAQRRFRVSS
ncbi:hypothetical protein PG994_000183 [Apiospora phragmitis]|uniref:Oxidoreductase acuF-like C2H2 type zinc-finger domain-containing protein n=1 Tax=Apiospora phragmitis TaxID=2905665 RepID=A0ABR1X5I8_9PEZI